MTSSSSSFDFWPSSRACPCGSGEPFGRCCRPRLTGDAPARTAEALMRSRYTAFVLRGEAYLLATWHPSTRPASLGLREEDGPAWLGLTVRRARGGPSDTRGTVEFVARFRGGTLHETSTFRREEGRWFYVDGDIHAG
ncbi:YchJ family protein [Deinococcus pimensis]|uniref:YchJ family protein n=1 Tax=Deinococcus pimensis TaxID=309888 RepID=UPI000489083B|nr:YchJ family protein [Deinococcus pimensis]